MPRVRSDIDGRITLMRIDHFDKLFKKQFGNLSAGGFIKPEII